MSPPPSGADKQGSPVVDIYVEAVPRQAPQPHVSRVTADSVSFTWDPVVDIGDGAGIDYFVAGMDHYTSWLTINGGAPGMPPLLIAAPRVKAALWLVPLRIAWRDLPGVDLEHNP